MNALVSAAMKHNSSSEYPAGLRVNGTAWDPGGNPFELASAGPGSAAMTHQSRLELYVHDVLRLTSTKQKFDFVYENGCYQNFRLDPSGHDLRTHLLNIRAMTHKDSRWLLVTGNDKSKSLIKHFPMLSKRALRAELLSPNWYVLSAPAGSDVLFTMEKQRECIYDMRTDMQEYPENDSEGEAFIRNNGGVLGWFNLLVPGKGSTALEAH
uniref:Uncharacterized protein n=1 Tax=Haptolina ericina TaxID=156174 RepID=A0A7S3BHB4_9EUKA|mmetsp:Transcript_59993/g.133701  ORF Transcript_59993/g.133701 Transcript_59993/m.133701 type:complete len:210 (+) Transcript_59993:3-632(+)